jgi:hypothetical protein
VAPDARCCDAPSASPSLLPLLPLLPPLLLPLPLAPSVPPSVLLPLGLGLGLGFNVAYTGQIATQALQGAGDARSPQMAGGIVAAAAHTDDDGTPGGVCRGGITGCVVLVLNERRCGH